MEFKLCVVSLWGLLNLMMSAFARLQAEQPPLRGGRIAGEVLAGGAGGVLVGGGSALLLWRVIDPDPGNHGYGHAFFELLFAGPVRTIGYLFGTSASVYLVGNMGDETGDFLPTFGGSIVGGILGWIGSTLIYEDEGYPFFDFSGVGSFLGGFRHSSSIGAAIGATIGATIGFNLTRLYKSPPTSPPTSGSQTNPDAPALYFELIRIRF